MTLDEMAEIIADLVSTHPRVQACGVLDGDSRVVGITLTDDTVMFIKVEGEDE